MIVVSVPAKIHLLGEHSVVYGKPALLAAIDKRLYVEILNPKSEIRRNGEIKIKSTENTELVWKTIEIFKKSFSIDKLPPLEITITSNIPSGSGLGSSAALSAALSGGLLRHVKSLWNPNKINELSFEVEKITHGNASGADNSTVVFGGLVWYRREFDFLKSIWNLPINTYKIPQFWIIDSGRPKETTKQMVRSVAHLYTKKRNTTEQIFADQEKQTKNLLLALKNGDHKRLLSSIRKGEENLERLGVVGNFAKKIIRSIETKDGAAKICGAGGNKEGSGIILCYHKDLAKLKSTGDKYKVTITPIRLGEEGIRLESVN